MRHQYELMLSNVNAQRRLNPPPIVNSAELACSTLVSAPRGNSMLTLLNQPG